MGALLLWTIAVCAVVPGAVRADADDPPAAAAAPANVHSLLAGVALPPGFSISLYSPGPLPSARSLALSDDSMRDDRGPVVYVSSSDAGKVWALWDSDNNQAPNQATELLTGLDSPVGIAWGNGSLYVAHWVNGTRNAKGDMEGGAPQIVRLADVDTYARARKAYTDPLEVVLEEGLPVERSHAYHYLRVTPNGRALVVPQGAPCNICIPPGGSPDSSNVSTTHANIRVYDLATGNSTLLATGVRNAVGFDWHPTTGEFWFTDNGRDKIGDDMPDCELNVVRASYAKPAFYGYPFCLSEGSGSPYLRTPGVSTPLNDPNVNAGGAVLNCSDPDSHHTAAQPMGPHTAPLGMRFYRRQPAALTTGAPTKGAANASAPASQFPAEYDRAAIVALHGSWNRELLNGYKVVAVHTGDRGAVTNYSVLADFLTDQGTASNAKLGRPVDVQQLPDGSLLVSDDEVGAVYRITHSARSPTNSAVGGATLLTAALAALLAAALLATS